MHRITGGVFVIFAFVCALLTTHGAALAQQITGKVDAIGFDGYYRPACWTPLSVQLALSGTTPGNYELRVYQHDLDGDQPYYTRPISLSGNGTPQSFWTVFLPEPIQGGLSDAGTSAAELAARLRVTVNDSTGREVAQVPIAAAPPTNLDPMLSSYQVARANRFVIFVGTNAAPPLRDYDPAHLLGVKEDLANVRLRPEQLPEIGAAYEAVDAIVWLEGDPSTLERGGGQRLNAIRDYVRHGGHLVLCTPTQWQQLAGFGDLMPVDISGTEQNALRSPVQDIADRVPFPSRSLNAQQGAPANDPWDRIKDPFTIATATPRPGAVVDLYADRVVNAERDEDRTPWLVRMPYGYGCVSWVGQDLGDRMLSDRANWGWPAVWETVLAGPGSASPAVFPGKSYVDRFKSDKRRDLGFTILPGLNLRGRAAQLIGLTVLFFVVYWFVAGPGAYFWLRYRGRATQNWFAFGVLAVGATALTLLVVNLVLRGAPEVRHVSLVRVDMADLADPGIARSEFGMYVPRDGAQRVELRDADLALGPTVTPFPIHPTLHAAKDGDRFLYAAPRQYRVNVPVGEAGESAASAADNDRSSAVTNVPFRTTMKRLQAEFVGPRDERITGSAALRPSSEGYLAGALRNETGHDLRNVYVAFRYQNNDGGEPRDWMMYVASWKANDPLDLAVAFNPPANKTAADMQVGTDEGDARPNGDHPVRGMMSDWRELFTGSFRGGMTTVSDIAVEDFDNALPASVPMLSFFKIIPPIENQTRGGDVDQNRADLFRSGVRDWDISDALMAGRLVVVAQADNVPIAVPLSVNGDPVAGSGTTIYQFVLPLTPIPAPPKQPATTQTTTQATQPTH